MKGNVTTPPSCKESVSESGVPSDRARHYTTPSTEGDQAHQ
jgi:hypothetical protein